MTEMVEKVARALCRLDIQIKRQWDTDPEKLSKMLPGAIDMHWPQYVDEARVAIAAMREYTVDMWSAGNRVFDDHCITPRIIAPVYEAMIDQALRG
jgi:hypothetical protein